MLKLLLHRLNEDRKDYNNENIDIFHLHYTINFITDILCAEKDNLPSKTHFELVHREVFGLNSQG